MARLLENPFPGSEQLVGQIQNCLVRSIDDNVSLDFIVSSDKKASSIIPYLSKLRQQTWTE